MVRHMPPLAQYQCCGAILKINELQVPLFGTVINRRAAARLFPIPFELLRALAATMLKTLGLLSHKQTAFSGTRSESQRCLCQQQVQTRLPVCPCKNTISLQLFYEAVNQSAAAVYLTIHCRAHNSSSLDPISSNINTILIDISYLSNIHFNSILASITRSPKWSLPFRFPDPVSVSVLHAPPIPFFLI